MKKPYAVVDTNLLVRYFTNDIPKQADLVESLLLASRPQSLFLSELVIAETIYVLQTSYAVQKEDVIEKVEGLLAMSQFKFNTPLIQASLEIYRSHSISFVDAYLLALVEVGMVSKIYSLDKKLNTVGKSAVTLP